MRHDNPFGNTMRTTDGLQKINNELTRPGHHNCPGAETSISDLIGDSGSKCLISFIGVGSVSRRRLRFRRHIGLAMQVFVTGSRSIATDAEIILGVSELPTHPRRKARENRYSKQHDPSNRLHSPDLVLPIFAGQIKRLGQTLPISFFLGFQLLPNSSWRCNPSRHHQVR